MNEPNNICETYLHDLIHAIQSSVELAEDVAREKMSFSIAEFEVNASLNFELKEADVKTNREKPKKWFSVFTKKEEFKVKNNKDNTQSENKANIRVLLKPGGKLVSQINGNDINEKDVEEQI